jgi:hypothetical protein
MSGAQLPRGSQTPTGKPQRSAFDYPLTPAQQSQLQASQAAQHGASGGAAAMPIHIAPRASPRGGASGASASTVAAVAQSCPAFSWQPPAAPSARPRIASIDPPPMELPPSPPVFSPMQAEQVKGKKDDPLALKKQIYSRSLSNSANYSSSAPTHVDYLSKFQPNLGQLDEAGAGAGDDSDEEEEDTSRGSYRASSRAQPQFSLAARRDVDEDDAESPVAGAARASAQGGMSMGMGIKAGSRVSAMQRSANDEFSLSKSPTIFSILSTSAHGGGGGAHLGLGLGGAGSSSALHTADTSQSSTASGSPGRAILGAIAAGGDVAKSTAGPAAGRPLQQQQPQQAGAAATKRQDDDDLQFNIQLDDQEGEGDEQQGGGNRNEFALY